MKKREVRADIRIRIRRRIIHIEIERSSIQTVIPITTEISDVRSIVIRGSDFVLISTYTYKTL